MGESIRLKKDEVHSNYGGEDTYDLLIIGAGISGLATGLMWVKNTEGKKTLLLEKNSYPGGYSTAYVREGYVFETTQLFPDIVDILEYLGLEMNLKRYEGDFMRRIVVHGDEVDEYHIPTGPEHFAEYLAKLFPGEADKIRKLIDYAVSMFSQVRKLKVIPTFRDKLITPLKAPKVVANLNRTYASFLDKFGITNPELREVMETFTSFSGVPSARASSILAIGAMLTSMTRCFRPYGFYDEFPAKMALLFQELQGEIRFNAEVEKIIVEDGKAVGVRVKGDDGMIQAQAPSHENACCPSLPAEIRAWALWRHDERDSGCGSSAQPDIQ
ncbi:MAG: NAD(P)/FAD-dependent oxidoreductase [Deltaproteobacteria bacterium]|nr:NAD(P)/FAD-dependent oxidoreductase [Deltaproteobacteria bacterium]